MQFSKEILVGVDPTVSGGCELEWADMLRQRLGLLMHAAFVLDPHVVQELRPALDDTATQSRVVADAEAELRTAVKRRLGDSPCTISVTIDEPARGLIRLAEVRGARLLVLGHPQSPLVSLSGGGVAGRCIRMAPVDVLIASAETQCAAPRRVLSCVKMAERDQVVLRRAAALAAAFDSELHILHVYDPPWRVLHYRSPTPQAAPEFRRQFTTLLHRHLETWCQQVLNGINSLSPPQYHLVEDGDPCLAACEVAEALQPELVVVGAGHPHWLRDWWTGRTPARLADKLSRGVYSVANASDEVTVTFAGRNEPARNYKAAESGIS